jgi:hypothetical protein
MRILTAIDPPETTGTVLHGLVLPTRATPPGPARKELRGPGFPDEKPDVACQDGLDIEW